VAHPLVRSLVPEIFVDGSWESWHDVGLDHVLWMMGFMVLLQAPCHFLGFEWLVQVWLWMWLDYYYY